MVCRSHLATPFAILTRMYIQLHLAYGNIPIDQLKSCLDLVSCQKVWAGSNYIQEAGRGM